MVGDNEDNKEQGAEAVIKKKRQKTSIVWNDFDEFEILGVGKKVVYRYCKDKLSTGSKRGKGEKKQLKTLLKTVSNISLTTDMWKSSHQVVEYTVITGWNLKKKVLSFVKVSAPRRGIDVADAILKCLKAWGIEDKVFSVSVNNISYNDSCLKNLKENLSLSRKMVLNGDLFHVRCCTHILNLLVQDGLGKIKDTIQNVHESVKYINHNDSRLKAFCDVAEQKHLKERKLIIDCPIRWNSTFQMLSTTLKFKTAFSTYSERDPHYTYAPSHEDWGKNAKVWRVKQVIDNALEDTTFFMREMAGSIRVNVLDPRCKFHVVNICFPLVYKSKEIVKENIEKYVTLSINESSLNEMNDIGINSSTTSTSKSSIVTGFDQIMNIVRANEAIPPVKSELKDYLKENVYIPETSNSSFSVLEWWRNNSLKYRVLSKMVGDILAIPISTVASESTFSAGGRVIDEYRSKLNGESIEALICGGDWLRHNYNLEEKIKGTYLRLSFSSFFVRSSVLLQGYGRPYFFATLAHTCTSNGNAMVAHARIPLEDLVVKVEFLGIGLPLKVTYVVVFHTYD
ncbi:Zinc finger BED domain-containing protein RICESLEEPER 2 [Glycine max]|nr:Zinc finger BED domain-containing protein RICESLEEPER 2 [Glycine max]